MTSTIVLCTCLLLLWQASFALAQDRPHVYLGRFPCEANQIVSLQEVPNAPGQYLLHFKKFKFKLVAVSTHSGVVRLEDPFSGATWVQLNSKSMLMDSRRGQRLVDDCQHPTQKAMAEAMKTTPDQPLIEVDTSTR
jgi:hypothetical protein